MSETNEQTCPECSAPRRRDGTPSCGCTLRASDALRDARTEEAAAAEDFDPLRIRPYVELAVPAPEAPGIPETAPERTMRLAAVREGMPRPDETMRLGAIPAPATDEDARRTRGPRRRSRGRRTALLATAGTGAVAAVVAAAGFASGLFSYSTPERDTAMPEDVRASVPDQPSPSEASSAPPSTVSAPPTPVSAPPSKSSSTSPSASPASASPSTSAPASPSPSATTARPKATASPEPFGPGGGQSGSQVLRPGDKGAGVTELQLRLNQLNLYWGPVNGHYSEQVESAVMTYQFARGITDDSYGVYGPATRAMLESETTRP
ncbi:peptidoglycan-binding protein [Streptomyces sp. NPDC047022]|uniref:peptidoglycan-binding domain-containing protein n=1 Tax=Streptomyces sp. NPDC047022 TaxID=3155737 RepID=UPI0033E28840